MGDAILDLVVGEYLFKTYPEMPEGELSKARASVVSESPLAACCAGFHMGDYILLGNGELASGGRLRASILADAFEAVVGAIYIDSSYEAARSFILYQLRDFLALVESGHYGKDYKTVFQEFIQRDGEQKIDYELCREEGPDHGISGSTAGHKSCFAFRVCWKFSKFNINAIFLRGFADCFACSSTLRYRNRFTI